MRISDWSSDVCSSDLSDNIFLLGFRTPEENRMLDNAEGMRAAEELTRAISSLDEAVFASIYTDDAEIWHNNTNAIQTKTENAALLGEIFAIVDSLYYADLKRLPTSEGFVQHHVVRRSEEHTSELQYLMR